MSFNKKAFTLIELLVVIAIIAILAAILFPVFAQAKQAAKKTTSLSNVKQLSLGNVLYAGDYDDLFTHVAYDQNGWPYWFSGSNNWAVAAANTLDGHALPGCGTMVDSTGGCSLGFQTPGAWPSWAQQIYPYVKSIALYQSSAAKDPSTSGWGYTTAAGAGNSSYFANGAAMDISQTQISDIASLIAFQGRSLTDRESLVQPTFNPTLKISNGIDITGAGSTYGDGDNYGFTDGHAKFAKRNAIKYRNFGVSGVVHQFNNGNYVADVPNTTGLTAVSATQPNNWQTWGTVDVSAL
jgi:prepilin-type N-terminal cleavage/methylation domain-containing protein